MRKPWMAIAGAVVGSLVALGFAYGFVRFRSVEQARALIQQVETCRSGSVSACDVLRDACAKRSGAACRELGRLHARGSGVVLNAAEARRYFEAACEHRDAEGCLSAADAAKEQGEARRYVESACRLGSPEGCRRAGAADP